MTTTSTTSRHDPELLRSEVTQARGRVAQLRKELRQARAEVASARRGVDTLAELVCLCWNVLSLRWRSQVESIAAAKGETYVCMIVRN